VRRRRRSLDLTQADLAQRVACAEITIRKIESDERRPSRRMAERLADALEVEPERQERFLASARALLWPARLGPAATDDAPALPGAEPLPAPLTPLIGRGPDLDAVLDLVACGGGPARLVTLTGPPGVGKTRFGLEVLARVQSKFDAPGVFVDLATETDPDALPTRIALALNVPAGSGDRVAVARGLLRQQPVVLLLDNLEQLTPGAERHVAELLGACPPLTCLATSRVRLDVYGEWEYALAPLAVPPDDVTDPDELLAWPAVELFVSRVRAAGRPNGLDGGLAAAADVCRVLDGLPLALELAALRTRHTPVAELALELRADTTALGAEGHRSTGHRTIDESLRWTFDALDGDARAILGAAAVFRAPPDLAALAAVSGLDPAAAAAAAARLVDHALLRRLPGTPTRHGLLAVVRDQARARLAPPDVDARHAIHVAGLVAAVAERGPGFVLSERVLAVLDAVVDDITAALAWCFGPGRDAALGRRLVIDVGYYWDVRDRWGDGLRWVDAAAATASDDTERACLALLRGESAFVAGDLGEARACFEEGIAGLRGSPQQAWLAAALGNAGMLDLVMGDLDRAAAEFDDSLAIDQALGAAPEAMAVTHLRIGRLAFLRGDLDRSDAENRAALDLYRQAASFWGVGTAHGNLADAHVLRGETAEARAAVTRSVVSFLDGHVEWFAASRLSSLGAVLVAEGRGEEAAELYGLVDAWLEDLGVGLHPVMAPTDTPHRERAREILGDEAFEVAWERGRTAPRGRADLLARVAPAL
jgi:predicted ATPase/transcriptional regulator with XRE-family HTH domain